MKYKVYSEREFKKLLKDNNYKYVRNNGSHEIWNRENANSISVPHSLNPMIIRRLIKENNLCQESKR